MEPINDAISDKSLVLYPHHTILTHLGCVALRCTIGVMLMTPTLSPKLLRSIMLLIIVVLIIFGSKYIKLLVDNTVVWKSYPRMLIAYSLALYLICKKQTGNAGLLIIADALMGVQGRHIASLIK